MMNLKRNKGITLIALIVTIIVLLILAGSSISMIAGNNGILNRTIEAKEITESAQLEEEIKLLITEAMIGQYADESNIEMTVEELQTKLEELGENVLVVQWNQYIIFDLDKNEEYRVMSDGSVEYWGESTMGTTLLNTKTANQDQLEQDSGTSNIIGIDNDGNTVNMLLWEYTLIDDSSLGKIGTYGLNDAEALTGSGNNRSAGYLGGYTEDGKIIGMMPAYISVDGGNTYVSVTSMAHTFYNCDELTMAPEISDTLINMLVAFYQASNLTTAPNEIPDSVINLNYAFANCEKLNTVPILGKNIETMVSTFNNTAITEFGKEIPNSVVNMDSTFRDCKSLTSFTSIIPDSVTKMSSTFRNCTSLITGPNSIPDSVTVMDSTFHNCTLLIEGPTTISDRVTNLQSTFNNCTSLVIAPSIIPSSVTNMFQTFKGCSELTGTIQINANLSGTIVYNFNGQDYKDYDECFANTATTGSELIISKNSICPELENLLNTKSSNSNITIEE